jgi:hypothetical protein
MAARRATALSELQGYARPARASDRPPTIALAPDLPGRVVSAGSGGNPPTLVRVESMLEADLRTALQIERASSHAWQSIATARAITISALEACLERYRRRSTN